MVGGRGLGEEGGGGEEEGGGGGGGGGEGGEGEGGGGEGEDSIYNPGIEILFFEYLLLPSMFV